MMERTILFTPPDEKKYSLFQRLLNFYGMDGKIEPTFIVYVCYKVLTGESTK
ncbi:hypothetical protein ACFOU2_14440 [Bacillus songklensis]|uniref:Uncharacterized protein n=1 Tax=Bacillus songklensis TaxID=1069116 RepID=A0ABV8B5P7_9BACI